MAGSSKNEINQKSTPEKVLLKEINDSLERIRSQYQARVYRVPQELRQVNESAYTPSLVSIGPLHSDDPHLQSQMRDVKLFYVNSLFLKFHQVQDAREAMKKCLDKMEESIQSPKVKNFYAEAEVNAEMLLIDGCFILELLRRYTDIHLGRSEESSSESSKSQKNNDENLPDPIFCFPLTRVAVLHDLLLLENQLPLLVLTRLFSLTLGVLPGHLHLSKYILIFFHGILNIGHEKSDHCPQKGAKLSPTCDQHEVDLEAFIGLEEYDHILHFLHSHYLPDTLPKPAKVVSQDQGDKFMPFASHLDSFGVKFEGNKDQFEAHFYPRLRTCRRACFSIPTLHIGDSTELVLRNFIAFEKCVPRVSGYFTSYAYLLDGLINTEADVQVLEEAEVIRNRLGTGNEASDLFNSLCKNVALGEFHFAKICDQVVEYNKHCWLAALPMTIQHVKRKLSAHPWTFIAFVVAFTAFAMQAIQFITSYTG